MNEVFITSSTGEAVELIKVWDSRNYTCLMTYRGTGVISPKGISILGSDYLIAAEKLKPILKVWLINSQQLLHSPRLLCPGKVSVMACSPDGYYIAVAVEEKLHVYQVSSGCLVGSGVHHFQAITVVRWCCDGSILACGGEDGLVTVWYLSNLVQRNQVGNPDPRYTFSDHSLPVTDLIITSGGSSCSRSRLVSVSCDRTCKMYDLSSGKLLLSIVFGEMLTSVSLTPSEMEIFVGAMTGDISGFSLRNSKSLNSSDIHINTGLVNDDNDLVNVFSGHKKSITCLSTSLEGDRLLSGSADETIRIWHILSKQCLKVLPVKGSVTNAFFIRMPKQMLEQEVKKNIMLCPFQKTADGSSGECNLQIVCNDDLSISRYDTLHDSMNDNNLSNKEKTSLCVNEDQNSLSAEVKRLRSVNEQLFKFSMNQLLSRGSHSPEKREELPKVNNDSSEGVKLKNSDIDNIFDEVEHRTQKLNKSPLKTNKGKKNRRR